MKLDLKALFGGDTQRIAIEEQLDFHDLQYGIARCASRCA